MADFAVKIDTKLNEVSEHLGRELHGVKDAIAMLQEGQHSALKNGEKVETLIAECTKVRDFESRINSVVRVVSSVDNIGEKIESKFNQKLVSNSDMIDDTVDKIRH